VVSTDTGHPGSGFDASVRQDQQASLDFLYVAIGRIAELGKVAVADYYTRPAEYSYYVGCSTGGREAMLMSQRYPAYFDGIVAGAPAIRTGHSNMSLTYINAAFNEFAPRDADGVPVMSELFSDSDKDLIVETMLNTCDLSDGLEDGMIFDTRGCGFQPSQLTCGGEKTDRCLAPNQVAALDTVDYYERMSEANGGMDAVREWSRAFVVPGMGHCSGGAVTADRFDMLTAIVDWVENGTAPDAVVATGSGGTRPLCPYPQYPHYTGGATDDPASYECRE
jgi:hypothetical protein